MLPCNVVDLQNTLDNGQGFYYNGSPVQPLQERLDMQVVNRYMFSSSTTEYEKNVATGTNKHREQCYKAAMERIRRECGIKDDDPAPQVTTEDKYTPVKGSLFC